MAFFWQKNKESKRLQGASNLGGSLEIETSDIGDRPQFGVAESSAGDRLSIVALSDLVTISGHPIGGEFRQSEYYAAPKQGGRSRLLLRASEGENWLLTANVRIVYRPIENPEATLLAGPLFLGAEGTVLQWWRPLPCTEGPISVKTSAPAGTQYVAAGIYGVWHKDEEPPLVKIAYSSITLMRRG